jgi:arginase
MLPDKGVVVLDAPSNLGLRPPVAGAVPGCYKLPWALRYHKLLDALDAKDGGNLVPPRYLAEWDAGEGDRNAHAIATFSVSLANRVGTLLDARHFVLVLGGDCSVLIGNMLALKRRGRYGLVFLDAHSDFRHPNNAPAIGAAAGEDLAIVTGRGDERLIDLEGLRPYVREEDIHLLGVRGKDEFLDEIRTVGMGVSDSGHLRDADPKLVADEAIATATRATDGFWLHLDMDVVDASEMHAVDCPEPNGISMLAVREILKQLVESRKCVGMEVTIYDPDLDPDTILARVIVDSLAYALAHR